MEGFQLWLNLAAKDKMVPAWYRDIPTAQIPEVHAADHTVRVIAGNHAGVAGAMQREHTEPLYLDIIFPEGGGSYSQPLPNTHNGFVYVYRGEVDVGGTAVARQRMAILANQGDGVTLQASGPARALLIAGKPLREPIAQHGPFVMNTRDELIQAVDDFQNGRLA